MSGLHLEPGLQFDVIGAHGPSQFFSRLTKETIAHAYLFTGSEGVGKKTFARRLAQSLLCEAPKAGVLGYDGTCNSCRLIGREETRHPDLLESVGALKIGDTESALGFHETEEITARDLVRQLSLQSYSGGFRVFILGDIDFATHHAANALLKFFEEPPSNVVLLLTTSTPGRLLTTIRSRLIELRFSTLKSAEVAEILRRQGYDEPRAELGAALSQGSVTRAVAALDEEESLRSGVAEWFFQCVRGESPEESWATRETLDEGLEVAISSAGRDAPVLAVDYRERLVKLPPIAADRSTAVLSKLTEAQRLARTNVSPAIVGEFVRMNITGAS